MATQSTATPGPFKDYYQILHLHPAADASMVDQAYWHLARLYNAAIPSDPSAGEKLEELNEAYSVLRSPGLRNQYDQMRNDVLGEGALPVEPEPEPEAPPLAVMAKQRPKPRSEHPDQQPEPKRKEHKRRRPRLQHVAIPPWQSLVGATVILMLAGAALATGAQPAFVGALLAIGLAFTTIPLVRRLPRLQVPPTPTLHLPSIRAPRLPERPTHAGVDADTLRRSTEEMRSRWRTGTEGLSTSSSPDPDPHAPPDDEAKAN